VLLSIKLVLEWLSTTFGAKKKMEKYDMPGDVIVCGVQADEVIEDLGKKVPKSVATHISADNANKSKDLWSLLSQSRLIRLNVNPLLRAPQSTAQASIGVSDILEAEYNKAVAEVVKLRYDLSLARTEAVTLKLELGLANEEIARLRTESSQSHKLDDILSLLKERALQVSADANVGIGPQYLVPDDYVPMFIPSQIKSDVTESSRVAVKEESSSSSALSDASRALREKRKKQ
jgi:hypothetical protein